MDSSGQVESELERKFGEPSRCWNVSAAQARFRAVDEVSDADAEEKNDYCKYSDFPHNTPYSIDFS